ncbi:MAG: hypothetical protein Q4B08_02400 [Propionibacteriaceae bacterium]|nr:hypothetical protein [Propionibacteriaceae bacterium]
MRDPRGRLWPAVALAALLTAPGCTPDSPPTVDSPVTITESSLSGEVSVVAETSLTPGEVSISYTVTNDSPHPVWVVDSARPSIIGDALTPDGVVAALVFFPVRGDVSYAQPPYEPVVRVAPRQSITGSVHAERPFVPFSDTDGDRAVALPDAPASIRLCIGHIAATELPPSQPGTLPDGRPKLDRDLAFPRQRLSCSTALPLA